MANPALSAFTAQIREELVLAQVLIRRTPPGYELRHAADRAAPEAELRTVALEKLREVAQFTAGGAFRPLKSAPNLVTGWRLKARGDAALEQALNRLYPGAIADWFAAQSPNPPVTNYREFTQRQTGMYRITQMLDDAQAGRVIRAACHPRFCLKRRWWTVDGLNPDSAGEKSLIPCLEPCAILLEFARTAMRLEQEDKLNVALPALELETLIAALQSALKHGDGGVREAELNSPDHPRRVELLLEKLREFVPTARPALEPSDAQQ